MMNRNAVKRVIAGVKGTRKHISVRKWKPGPVESAIRLISQKNHGGGAPENRRAFSEDGRMETAQERIRNEPWGSRQRNQIKVWSEEIFRLSRQKSVNLRRGEWGGGGGGGVEKKKLIP